MERETDDQLKWMNNLGFRKIYKLVCFYFGSLDLRDSQLENKSIYTDITSSYLFLM